jgi:hypothetical protein
MASLKKARHTRNMIVDTIKITAAGVQPEMSMAPYLAGTLRGIAIIEVPTARD